MYVRTTLGSCNHLHVNAQQQQTATPHTTHHTSFSIVVTPIFVAGVVATLAVVPPPPAVVLATLLWCRCPVTVITIVREVLIIIEIFTSHLTLCCRLRRPRPLARHRCLASLPHTSRLHIAQWAHTSARSPPMLQIWKAPGVCGQPKTNSSVPI